MTYLKRNGWNLTRSGGSVIYVAHEGQFVARFKYARPGVNATAFCRFLVENFTVEEYFAQRAAGVAPLTILESKGYVSPNVQYARQKNAEYKANK